MTGGDGTVRGGTEGTGRGIGVWRGTDGIGVDNGLDDAMTGATRRMASGGAVAVSVAGRDGGGAAHGGGAAAGDDECKRRALGGGGGMLRGGALVASTVEAAGSVALGATLR
ncbi:MAG TPA: hypothetical protein VM686_31450, partial [Polyangiaceae bacterium]|nr:hypothetical protein [Polyangiaceae bacterium]